ncbi:MAG: hypothetical protein AAF607_03870 [Pseudomonadota bacterium]
MNAPRHPMTWASAATWVIAQGLLDEAAELIGKSPELIRKWANQNMQAVPNVQQALVIDQLCLERFDREPFAEVAERRKGRADTAPKKDILAAFISATAAQGEASRVFAEALEDGEVTVLEASDIVESIERSCAAWREVIAAASMPKTTSLKSFKS